jgi:DNA-binding NarL/FixJ family response regulator
MDIRMPEMDGIEATRQIVRSTASPATQVLILTTFDLDEYVYAALRAGASGFLTKDTPPTELISAIRVISAGDALISPQITRRLIETFLNAAEITPADIQQHEALAAITEREREVLALLGHGLSNAEIGRQLRISPNTTRTHVRHLLTKLDARDRVHLVVLAGLADC